MVRCEAPVQSAKKPKQGKRRVTARFGRRESWRRVMSLGEAAVTIPTESWADLVEPRE